MGTELAVAILRAVVRCEPSLVVAADAAPVCLPNDHKPYTAPQSVNSLVVAAVEQPPESVTVRKSPYQSVLHRAADRRLPKTSYRKAHW